VNRRDAAGIVTLCGVAALAASLSGAVLDFLRPTMRGWVGLAGGILVVIGIAELWQAHRDSEAHGHDSPRVGWLVAVPIVVAVTVGSGSLGVYAVGRNATFANLPDAPTSYDLEQYVRSASFGGQPVELTLVDFVVAAATPENRAVLEGHDLRLIGFLARTDAEEVRLTRFVISCCAADGSAVQVVLDNGNDLPADGAWLEVTGTLAPTPDGSPSLAGDGETPLPHLDVGSFREIAEPDLPYEVPVARIGR
jgi:uncharacterized repeat protein (TIGR03943 family)